MNERADCQIERKYSKWTMRLVPFARQDEIVQKKGAPSSPKIWMVPTLRRTCQRLQAQALNRKEVAMSTLVALMYPDVNTARLARAKLQELQTQQLITLDDAVIATHEGDKVKLDQAMSLTGAGAAGGALWGGLFGLLFLVPIAGMAIGAATGALAGKFSDYGVDDNFAKQVGTKLTPGKAALVLLIRQATGERVVEEMSKAGLLGEVVQTNLSTEDEQRLRGAVTAAQSGSGQGADAQPPA
jgi:uncharacterized membrane protein